MPALRVQRIWLERFSALLSAVMACGSARLRAGRSAAVPEDRARRTSSSSSIPATACSVELRRPISARRPPPATSSYYDPFDLYARTGAPWEAEPRRHRGQHVDKVSAPVRQPDVRQLRAAATSSMRSTIHDRRRPQRGITAASTRRRGWRLRAPPVSGGEREQDRRAVRPRQDAADEPGPRDARTTPGPSPSPISAQQVTETGLVQRAVEHFASDGFAAATTERPRTPAS